MLPVNIADVTVNQILLPSAQLLTDVILGLDLPVDHHAVINFVGRRITLQIDGEYTEGGFTGIKETTNKLGSIEQSSSENQLHMFGLVSNFPRKLLSLTAC